MAKISEFQWLCLLIFLAGLVATVLGARVQRVKMLNRTYSTIVERLGGAFHAGHLWRTPSATFSHAGLDAQVKVFSSSGNRDDKFMTQFRIAWPDRTLRCSLYPERAFALAQKLIGVKDIQIGDQAFDRRYMIKGADEDRVRQLLSLPVRRQIDALYSFLHSDHVFVQFGGGALVIKKRGLLQHPHSMMRFIELCLAIVDSAGALHADDIQFVEGSIDLADVVIDEAYCQICGESAESDVVFCKSCGTPHHRECWDYYGACSTYGCGQTRYVDKPPSS